MKFRTSKPAWAVTVLALLSTVTQTQALDYIATVTNTPNLLGFWQFDPVYQSNSCVNGYTGTSVSYTHLMADARRSGERHAWGIRAQEHS